MDALQTAVGKAVKALVLNTKAYRATQFLSPTMMVRVTRRHKNRKTDKTQEFVVTVGRPNFTERNQVKRKGKPNGMTMLVKAA